MKRNFAYKNFKSEIGNLKKQNLCLIIRELGNFYLRLKLKI